ncbi:MAG: hypothetical protein ACP5JH_04025 [Bacteroidota bacterium]
MGSIDLHALGKTTLVSEEPYLISPNHFSTKVVHELRGIRLRWIEYFGLECSP